MDKYKFTLFFMCLLTILFFLGSSIQTVSVEQSINIQKLHESIVNLYYDISGTMWTLFYDKSLSLLLEGKINGKKILINTGITIRDITGYNKGILIDIPIFFSSRGIFILNIQKAELIIFSFEGEIKGINKYDAGSDILWEIPYYNFRTQRTETSYDWHKQFFYVLEDGAVIFNWLIYYNHDNKNNLPTANISNSISNIFVFDKKGFMINNYFNDIFPFMYKRGDFNFGADSLFLLEQNRELLFYFGNEDSVFIIDLLTRKTKMAIINEEKMSNLTYNTEMSFYMTEIFGSKDNMLFVTDPKQIKIYSSKDGGKLFLILNDTVVKDITNQNNNAIIEKLVYADKNKVVFLLKKATNKKGLHSKDQSAFFLYTVNLN